MGGAYIEDFSFSNFVSCVIPSGAPHGKSSWYAALHCAVLPYDDDDDGGEEEVIWTPTLSPFASGWEVCFPLLASLRYESLSARCLALPRFRLNISHSYDICQDDGRIIYTLLRSTLSSPPSDYYRVNKRHHLFVTCRHFVLRLCPFSFSDNFNLFQCERT